MEGRPEYVTCVLLGTVQEGTETPINETWCGRTNLSEFVYQDASHAALDGRRGGRLLPCPACRKAIVSALRHEYSELLKLGPILGLKD